MLDMAGMDRNIGRATRLLEMLAQPSRLKILCLLLEGEESVTDLAEAAGLSQPAMSHHLRKLRDAGLVETRRDGQTIFYGLHGNEAIAILETLHELYCSDENAA